MERNDVDDEYSKYWDNGLAMSYICFLVGFSLLFCLGWWIISLITPTRQTSNRVGSLSGWRTFLMIAIFISGISSSRCCELRGDPRVVDGRVVCYGVETVDHAMGNFTECYDTLIDPSTHKSILDMGCGSNLVSQSFNHMLSNVTKSTLLIRGFKGSDITQGDKCGYLHLYVIGNDQYDGGYYKMKVDTVPGINNNLLSVGEMIKKEGFVLQLSKHDGSLTTNHNQSSSQMPIHFNAMKG